MLKTLLCPKYLGCGPSASEVKPLPTKVGTHEIQNVDLVPATTANYNFVVNRNSSKHCTSFTKSGWWRRNSLSQPQCWWVQKRKYIYRYRSCCKCLCCCGGNVRCHWFLAHRITPVCAVYECCTQALNRFLFSVTGAGRESGSASNEASLRTTQVRDSVWLCLNSVKREFWSVSEVLE